MCVFSLSLSVSGCAMRITNVVRTSIDLYSHSGNDGNLTNCPEVIRWRIVSSDCWSGYGERNESV